jgi:hypothetical protein
VSRPCPKGLAPGMRFVATDAHSCVLKVAYRCSASVLVQAPASDGPAAWTRRALLAVRRFLNRLLGLPLAKQNLLFRWGGLGLNSGCPS